MFFYFGPKYLILGTEVSFQEGLKCLFKKGPKCPIGAEVVRPKCPKFTFYFLVRVAISWLIIER